MPLFFDLLGLFSLSSRLLIQATSDDAEKYCYANDASNCTTYGGLYQWHSAMWERLDAWVDNDNDGVVNNNEGISLKSTTGWRSGNGTDAYGWRGLPGGRWYEKEFEEQRDYGYWWSSTQNDKSKAWYRYLYYDYLYEHNYSKSAYGFSVRCLRDN